VVGSTLPIPSPQLAAGPVDDAIYGASSTRLNFCPFLDFNGDWSPPAPLIYLHTAMSRLSMTAVPTMDHIQAVDARKAPTRVAAPFDGRSWLGMDMGTPSCSSSASSSSLSASDSSPSSTSLSSVASFNVVPASKVRKRPSLADDISLKLIFMALGSSEDTLPPAFFPASRISFAPRLRIRARDGFPYSALGGMQLGVTGMYEMLDGAGKVTSKRMVADFCTDLSSGLEIWKRDADAARQTQEVRSSDMLPSGTYLLPLSLKLPQSDRL
jgi:hypothetical protein